MRNQYFPVVLFVIFLAVGSAFGQTVVVNDPLKEEKVPPLAAADEALVKKSVLPRLQKHWAQAIKDGSCGFDFEPMGYIRGSFSKAGASQTLVFLEVCQTGNGFGNNGLALLENGRVVSVFVSEGGWTMSIKSLPDINKNGLNEFAVYYSGGMHQGQGGVGVDILELTATGIRGIGWFQADSFGESRGDYSYKITAKPGRVPMFYREKYTSISEKRWRKSGKIVPYKLEKIACDFAVLK